MKKIFFGAVVCCGMMMAGLFLFSHTAGAYAVGATGNPPPAITTGTVAGYLDQAQKLMNSSSSLPAAPSWLSNALSMVGQWFQNVMAQGAQSTGAPIVPTGVSGSFGSAASTAQNIFMQFDAWLYSIIHFHISFIVNFIFGLVGWVLGIAVNVVDWLNSIFRSATGK